MANLQRYYIAIDLKSFYASVECIQRRLDPLDTLLIVADKSRTDKTICLAVSPALKAYGTGGRPRLFEVKQKIIQANINRGKKGTSTSAAQLAANPQLAIDFIIAPPHMANYIKYSNKIHQIYLRYIAPEDIHVYSIDEVFIDATSYLKTYHTTPHNLAMTLIREVLKETGITATGGIGTNMYLAKIAMDIVAKKMPPDKDGVRIAELDEITYRKKLWTHTPLTDFWRIGRGTARHLALHGIYTMGDIALTSHNNEEWLYKEFGINAELLIDHAWGWEPVTMDLVKAYKPDTHSFSSGQVLTQPYNIAQARNVIMEMADAMALDLIDNHLCTSQLSLTIGYDVESLKRQEILASYHGKIRTDHYGRKVPNYSNGSINLERPTSSATIMIKKITELFDRIANPILLVRRLNLSANKLIDEAYVEAHPQIIEPNLFCDYDEQIAKYKEEEASLQRERHRQEAVLRIKKLYGKNAILKGINYTDGATQRQRNSQIGGHHE